MVEGSQVPLTPAHILELLFPLLKDPTTDTLPLTRAAQLAAVARLHHRGALSLTGV